MNALSLFMLTSMILLSPIAIVVIYIICNVLQSFGTNPYHCPLSPRERKKVREQAFLPIITTHDNKFSS